MEVTIFNKIGVESEEKVHLNDTVFGQTPHEQAMFQAVQAQQTHLHHGTHATKNRARVAGGGKKPFRQKGTGRARAGTSRSPLWRGGGRVFGPLPHAYKYKLPAKIKLLGRLSALSYVAQNGILKVVEDFDLDEPKTKQMISILRSLQIGNQKVLLVTTKSSRNLKLACRNIPFLSIREYRDLSTYDILNCVCFLIQKSALDGLNRIGGNEGTDLLN